MGVFLPPDSADLVQFFPHFHDVGGMVATDGLNNLSHLFGVLDPSPPEGQFEHDFDNGIPSLWPAAMPTKSLLLPGCEPGFCNGIPSLWPAAMPTESLLLPGCEPGFCSDALATVLREIMTYLGLTAKPDRKITRLEDRARRRAYHKDVEATWGDDAACWSEGPWWRVDQWWVDWFVISDRMWLSSYRVVTSLVIGLLFICQRKTAVATPPCTDRGELRCGSASAVRMSKRHNQRPSLFGCAQKVIAAHIFVVAVGVLAGCMYHFASVAPVTTAITTISTLTVTVWLPYVVSAVALTALLVRVLASLTGVFVLVLIHRALSAALHALDVLFSPATASALVLARSAAIVASCCASVLNSALVCTHRRGVAVYLYLAGRAERSRYVTLAQRCKARRDQELALGVVADVLENELKSAEDILDEKFEGWYVRTLIDFNGKTSAARVERVHHGVVPVSLDAPWRVPVGTCATSGYNTDAFLLRGLPGTAARAHVSDRTTTHMFLHDLLNEALGLLRFTPIPSAPLTPWPASSSDTSSLSSRTPRWADRMISDDESDTDDDYDAVQAAFARSDRAARVRHGTSVCDVSQDLVPRRRAEAVMALWVFVSGHIATTTGALFRFSSRMVLLCHHVRYTAIRLYRVTPERFWRFLASVAHTCLTVVPGVLDRLIGLSMRVTCDASSRYVALLARYRAYSSAGYRLAAAARVTRLACLCGSIWAILIALPRGASAGGDDHAPSSSPPLFDGTASSFLAWFMKLGAWVAWRLSKASPILAEVEARPVRPHGAAPAVVVPTFAQDGTTVNNQALVDASVAARAVWDAAEAAFITLHDDWNDRNLKLYGAVCMAVPDWLRTSLYNDCANDGLAAITFLRNQFDATDDNDHAAHMARIQASYIEARNDISENDLRLQFDSMQIAKAGIIRTKNAPPPESAMKVMFDNALPASYSTIRQLVRRAGHTTFLQHYGDYVGQVRAELASRRPTVAGFSAGASGEPAAQASFIPAPPGTGGRGRGAARGRGGARGGARGGGRGRGSASEEGAAGLVKFCFRCLSETCAGRASCTHPVAKCNHCGADHHGSICPKGPGSKRFHQLSPGALSFLRRDVRMADPAGAAATTPAAHSAAATTPAPTYAAAAATPAIDPAALAQAQAAAAQAAAAHSDPGQSGAAYTAALRSLGYGMMCRLSGAPCASAASLLPPGATIPKGATLSTAHVDTMATLWILNDRNFFHRVTNSKPGFSLETAQGSCPVELVGDAFVHLRDNEGSWRAFEIRNVLYIPKCPANLYSTRAMRDAFGFHHDVDGGLITLPSLGGANPTTVRVTDDGRAFSVPVCFSAEPPRDFEPWPFDDDTNTAMLAMAAAFPAGVSGTTQATLYHRLGFPHDASWRHVAAATGGHGLPPDTVLSGTIPVSDSVMRGRERAAQWVRKPLADTTQPPPGAVLYADFCGPMVASHPHRFTCYCGYVDAGSGYGRLFPAHAMTAAVAIASLEVFIADLAAKMGLGATFKPNVVRCDQGGAFIAHHFQEFLSERQIQQSLAAVYTPQQNSHIERFWGSVFGTTRVLLAAANLPPTFHPFATQTAAWLSNRLPRPSRGNHSPVFLLSRVLPLLGHLYAFGCLCAVALHTAWRKGDKHFADRGEPALYMGPSESSPAHVVYLLSSKRVASVPHVRAWEDRFPGVKGMWYKWFPADARDTPTDVATDTVVASGAEAPRSEAVTTDPEGTRPSDAPPPGPAPPIAAQPQASPSQEGLRQAPPATPASQVPLANRLKPRSQWQSTVPQPPPATPMRQPDLSVESAATRHPGHDDPSSVHFERRRSTRPRFQTTLPNVASMLAAERDSRAAAIGIYSMIALGVVTAAPEAPGLALPAFAYACYVHGVDGAFGGYDAARDSDCLLHAATTALGLHAYAVTLTADFGGVEIPRSYKQALASKHAEYWREAIAKELGGLLKLGTWEMMPYSDLPKGANVMRCHFVFTVKRLSDGSIEKFKARLVADGNTQKAGVDFDRIFSTVVKSQTIRAVLIYACSHKLNLSSIDVRQAYCRGDADRDLFMSPPPGVTSRDSRGRQLVCRLKRSLYGLKQAGRIWAKLFSEFLLAWGMVRSSLDVCLYTYTSGKSILFVLVYVDDCLAADNDPELRARFVKDVAARFPIEDRGDLRWFLGIAIERDLAARTLRLSQKLYISDTVAKYGDWLRAGYGRKFDSPMAEGTVLSAADSPVEGSAEYAEMASRRDIYMQIVGAFSWLANMTMPWLCYPCSQLSRFLANPGMPHFDAAMRVLAFIDGLADPALDFTPNPSRGLEIFVDSNWSSRFSCSGAIFMLYGCPFHWFAKTQKSVALSSAEAEFFGAMLAARDGVWARDLLFALDVIPAGPTVIYSDSKSAVDLAYDPVAFKNTKHILRASNFLRDLVAREVFVVEHVPGVTMLADLLTKAVSRPVFLNLMRLLANYAATGEASLSAKPARASS
jgi:transposase InsO family protein